MEKLLNIIYFVWGRTYLLYAVAVLTLITTSNPVTAQLKILNHLRNSGRYINQYAEFSAPYNEKKVYQSIEYHKRLIKLIPKRKFAHGVLGYTYYMRGEIKNAIRAYSEAVRQLPGYFGFYYNLGVLYYVDGQYDKAAETLFNAVKIDPELSVAYQIHVGEKMMPSKRTRDAWVVRQGMKLDEAYENSYKIIIQSYDKRQRYPELFKLSLNCLGGDFKDPSFFLFYGGKAAYHTQRYKDAVELLSRYLKNHPDDIQGYYYMDLVYEKIGKDELFARLMQKYNIDLSQKNEHDLLDVKSLDLLYYMPSYEIGIVPLSNIVQK